MKSSHYWNGKLFNCRKKNWKNWLSYFCSKLNSLQSYASQNPWQCCPTDLNQFEKAPIQECRVKVSCTVSHFASFSNLTLFTKFYFVDSLLIGLNRKKLDKTFWRRNSNEHWHWIFFSIWLLSDGGRLTKIRVNKQKLKLLQRVVKCQPFLLHTDYQRYSIDENRFSTLTYS